ncbi:MAG: hypothetical protein JNM24_17460 [Bdellovibrionaceae bacterium]|nr:hypothetical protein [Pseudobdellovibrionaceae bacterium]
MSEQILSTAKSCQNDTEKLTYELFGARSNTVFSRNNDLIAKVSQEIKNYEEYLKSHKIILEFGMQIERDFTQDPQLRIDGENDIKYALHWGKLEGQKEYRLYYERIGTGFETFDGCTSDFQILEFRPVVEAPVEIRIFLRRWLNVFNERFTDYLEYLDTCNFEPLPIQKS